VFAVANFRDFDGGIQRGSVNHVPLRHFALCVVDDQAGHADIGERLERGPQLAGQVTNVQFPGERKRHVGQARAARTRDTRRLVTW
jgi:hypothetical protein